MFKRLSQRDEFGYPIKYRNSASAGLVTLYNDEDTILYLNGSLTDTALGNLTPLVVLTNGETPIVDGAIDLDDGYFYLASNTIADFLKPDQEWTVDLLITPSSLMVTNGQTNAGLFGYDAYNGSGAIYYAPVAENMSAYFVSGSTTANGSFPIDVKQLLSIEYYNDNDTRHFALYRNGTKLIDKIHTMGGDGLNVGIPMYFSISSDGSSRKFRGKYHNVRISKIARYGGLNFQPKLAI